MAPVIGNQRLESEKRSPTKDYVPKDGTQTWWLLLSLELSPGARVNERCKSDQANLLAQKIECTYESIDGQYHHISRSTETVLATCQALRLLAGEEGVKQQENSQSICSSLLSS